MKGLRSSVPAAAVLLALALVSTSDAQKPQVEHQVDDHAGSFSPDGKTILFERFFSTTRYGVDTHQLPLARATPSECR